MASRYWSAPRHLAVAHEHFHTHVIGPAATLDLDQPEAEDRPPWDLALPRDSGWTFAHCRLALTTDIPLPTLFTYHPLTSIPLRQAHSLEAAPPLASEHF